MMVRQTITPIEMPSQEAFIDEYIAKNLPVVVRGVDYDPAAWSPDALSQRAGDLTALVYGSLFDLEDIQSLEDYFENWFGFEEGEIDSEVPYIRWYNKLRDVEFAWGDEAFARVADGWRMPACLPRQDLIVPVSQAGAGINPVKDHFPYRGLLVAARGARTRMHRDPFFSDAVVCQFYGTKEVALYHPSRTAELTQSADGTSFGGFIDVRAEDPKRLSIEPDFHGYVGPGEMVYIPHGWLHDVIALEDTVSITWNFIHRRGVAEFAEYLGGACNGDPEFDILQYFHRSTGRAAMTAQEISAYHFGGA